MKKLIGFLVLGLILVVLFPYQEVSAELPSCDFSHLGLCNDQSSCEGAGGYWCDNSCQMHSCPPVCDSEHLLLCLTQEGCEGAGGYWCDNSCQMHSCPPVCDSDPGNPDSKCSTGLPWLMLLLD